MQQFLTRFQDPIQGVVSGLDRVLFRGSLRNLNHAHGMEVYLYMNDILFKDYDSHVKRVSRRLNALSIAPVLEQKLPVEYLRSGEIDKDQLARQIPAQPAIPSGDARAL